MQKTELYEKLHELAEKAGYPDLWRVYEGRRKEMEDSPESWAVLGVQGAGKTTVRRFLELEKGRMDRAGSGRQWISSADTSEPLGQPTLAGGRGHTGDFLYHALIPAGYGLSGIVPQPWDSLRGDPDPR